jgi:hypothetical protein
MCAKNCENYYLQEALTLNGAKEKLIEFDNIQGLCKWEL